MIITEILGNTHDEAGAALIGGRHVEEVALPGDLLLKRRQRVTTDHGTEIGLQLPQHAPELHDGDILHIDAGGAVVVSVLPTDVLVIAPRSITEMGFLAHSLGNRHLQAQFFDAGSDYAAEVMVVRFDHTVESFLSDHGIPFSRQDRVMPTPFRHAEHSH
ncbi:urease accessory protein UreE [Corynebacterium pacaense]|uniref:urease accessory protein UreE n=1 Tax=Corynebacterium pacaense TaxID=1816684 RepID=UPI0009BA9747|nr:urease accessory protein UreE [Corynebacterium pacaense]